MSRMTIPILLVPVFIVLAFTVQAQEPVFLNQQLTFKYDQYQFGLIDPVSRTEASYDFLLGLPVFSYRLGSFALNGGIDYNRLTVGSESSSDTGLNRYGLSAFLFPFRQFQFSLSYLHSESPSLFDAGESKANTYGFDATFLNRKLPTLRFQLRFGTVTQDEYRQNWNRWSVRGDKKIKNTYLDFETYRTSYSDPFRTRFTNTALVAGTRTPFSNRWRLITSTSLQGFQDRYSLNVFGNLEGRWGSWTSTSTIQNLMNDYSFLGTSRFSQVSEYVSNTRKRLTLFGGTSFFDSNIPAIESSSLKGFSLTNGAIFHLTRNWSLGGDISLTNTTTNGADLSPINQEGTTYHAALVRGGEIPGLIRRSLFFVSDLSFSRRVQDEYPPGYVPPDVANDMRQRRIEQGGSLGFSIDYWKTQLQNAGDQTWARVTGSIQLKMGFSGLLLADWKKDDDFPLPGVQQNLRAASGSAIYSFGRSSLSGSVGYVSSFEEGLPLFAESTRTNNSTFSAGFNSRFWIVPYGLQVQKLENGIFPSSTNLSVFSSLELGKLGVRVGYDVGWRADGLKSHRIVIDLFRFFDTLILWGGGF